MNKLYLLETAGLGNFYVVAENSFEAEKKLKALLDMADYGFSDARKVKIINVLAQEVHGFACKPFFSSDDKLILPDTCASLFEEKKSE